MSSLVREFSGLPSRADRPFDVSPAAAAALDRLAAFRLVFEHGALLGRAVPCPGGGWAYEHSPALRALFDAMESTGFLLPADRIALDVDLHAAVARAPSADVEEAREVLSALVHRERREPGALAEPVRLGLVRTLFRRLEELRDGVVPRSLSRARPAGRPRAWPPGAFTAPPSEHPAPAIRALPSAAGQDRGLLARPGAHVADATAILADLLLALAAWDDEPRLGDARFLVLSVREGEMPSFVQVLSDPTQPGLLVEVDSGFFEPAGAWRATPEQRALAGMRGFSDGTTSNFAKVVSIGSFDDAACLAGELMGLLEDLCGWAPGEPIELVIEPGAAPDLHQALSTGQVEELLRRAGLGAREGEATSDDAPVDEDVAVVRSATRGVPFAAVLSERQPGPLPRFAHVRLQARFTGQFPPAVAERFNAEASAGRATRDGKALVVALDVPLEGGVSEPALRAAVERFTRLVHAARLFVARCRLRPSRLGVLRRAHFKPKVQDLERRLLRLVVPGRVEDVVQELAEKRAGIGASGSIAQAMADEITRIVREHQDWTWIKDLTCPSGVDAEEMSSVLGVLGGPSLGATPEGLLAIGHPCRDVAVTIDPRAVRQVSFSARRDDELYAVVRLRGPGGERRFVVTPDDVGFAPVAGEDLELCGVRVAVRPSSDLVTTGEATARLVALERALVAADVPRVLRLASELVACLLGARAAGVEVPTLERRLATALASLRMQGDLRPT